MMPEVKKLSDLGIYEFDCKNFDNAYDYYKRAIELDPSDAYIWYKRSVCAIRLGKNDEFFAGFKRAIELSKDELSSEIRANFHYERASIFSNNIDEACFDAASAQPNTQGDLTRVNRCDLVQQCAKHLFIIRMELKSENKLNQISDSDAIKTMEHIFAILVRLFELKYYFGSAEKIWRKTVAKSIAPCLDNTVAWLNFKLNLNKYSSNTLIFK